MSGRANPLVSIGMPVFNGAAQVARALESLRTQTVDDLEIVICDNASTDATESICREVAAVDPRVRYVRGDQNIGVARNFNKAFRLSTGRYFKWASSNDVHAPTYVEKCLKILESDPGVVLAYPKTGLIDDEGAFVRDYEDNLDLPSSDPAQRFREFLARVGLCNALYGLMRPSVVERTGKLGNYKSSDTVFLAELTLYGTFVEIPERLFFRRAEKQSAERNATQENWEAFFDPGAGPRLGLRTWRIQYEYFASALHAPISLPAKARVLGVVARNCVADRRDLMSELAGVFRRNGTRRPT